MVPLASLAALICVGIGVDFSGQTIAEQDLRDQASHCAREGAVQATTGAQSTSEAISIAYQCLATQGLTGTVSLAETMLVVEVTGVYKTKLLSIVTIDKLPLRGYASTNILQDR